MVFPGWRDRIIGPFGHAAVFVFYQDILPSRLASGGIAVEEFESDNEAQKALQDWRERASFIWFATVFGFHEKLSCRTDLRAAVL